MPESNLFRDKKKFTFICNYHLSLSFQIDFSELGDRLLREGVVESSKSIRFRSSVHPKELCEGREGCKVYLDVGIALQPYPR